MFKRLTISTAAILCLSFSVLSQTVYTPGKGSSERKAILDALRLPVEKKLRQKIVFAAEHFNVSGNWAFIGGEPQTPGGGEPDYRGTPYQEAKAEGIFDSNFFAVLKRTAGRWRVVTYAIGCTDVCYADWWSRYRAPKAIFPYTE